MKLNKEELSLLVGFAWGQTMLFSGDDDFPVRIALRKLQSEELIIASTVKLSSWRSPPSFTYSYSAIVTPEGYGIFLLLQQLALILNRRSRP